MQSKTQSNLYLFLKEWIKIFRNHPADEILRIIAEIEVKLSNPVHKNIIEFILTITSDSFNVTTDDIVNSPKRGKVSDARKISMMLFKSHLPITELSIAKYFGKTKQNVNVNINEMKSIKSNSKNKQEKEFYETFQNLNQQVLDYKKKLLLKNKIK